MGAESIWKDGVPVEELLASIGPKADAIAVTVTSESTLDKTPVTSAASPNSLLARVAVVAAVPPAGTTAGASA